MPIEIRNQIRNQIRNPKSAIRNPSSLTIVSSRSEPVETIAARTPDTSSSRAMYLLAASGNRSSDRTPAVGAVQPGIDS
jgi:hypothetical protein